MLIIRKLEFFDAASGIVTLSKWPSGAPDDPDNIILLAHIAYVLLDKISDTIFNTFP